jgi:TRAP-type uncharacterized transport system substrate-binding protein
MKPEARKLIKLLRFDPDNPASAAALKTYFPATVRASSYPNLITEDVPSIAVKAFLVTYDFRVGPAASYLAKFARSLCQNFGKLQAEGHPKWREVKAELPELSTRGWAYYAPMERELRACFSAMSAPKPVSDCTLQAKVLGLCK